MWIVKVEYNVFSYLFSLKSTKNVVMFLSCNCGSTFTCCLPVVGRSLLWVWDICETFYVVALECVMNVVVYTAFQNAF